MNSRTARKIERYARVNGCSFERAASELGKRGAKVSNFGRKAKSAEQINQERFEQMKASRPDLYS
jgi:hypothetical protein